MGSRAFAVLTLAATMLLVPTGPPVTAAAPSNDTWQTASEVTSLPFSAEVDLSTATSDAEEVAVARACGQEASPGVWFTYTPRSGYQQRIVSPRFKDLSTPGGTIVRKAQNGALEPVSCAGSSRTVLLDPGTRYFVLFSRGRSVHLFDVTCFPEPGDPGATGGLPPCPPSVVGAPGASVQGKRRAGAVELRFRSSFTTFFRETLTLTQGDRTGDRPEVGDRFGAVVTQGLVDDDELTDVVIGVPAEDVRGRRNAGAVHVVFGAHEGLGRGRPSLVLDQLSAVRFPDSTRHPSDGPEAGDRFGSALAVSSSHHILAVGVPGEDVAGRRNAGSVALYRFAGVTDPPAEQVMDQGGALAGRIERGNRVGSALGWTVQPHDGHQPAPGLTLVIGAPGDDVSGQADAGSVLTWSEWSGWTQRFAQGANGVPGRPEKDDRFGASIATADLAYAESVAVAVGVPGEDRGRLKDVGQVAFLSGEHVGRGMQACSISVPGRFRGGQPSVRPGDRFGAVMAFRRIDEVVAAGVTGDSQLLVGLPARTVAGRSRAGALYVADLPDVCGRGRPGSAKLITQASPGVRGRAERGDRFASAVSTVPLPRLSGLREEGYWVTDTVMVGAPGEDLAGTREAGTVQQLLPTGPAVVGPGGVPTDAARFGASLD